ncbi:MAG TPA: hypothetical protein VGF16_06890 [Bryobacteraceae bacterium]
MPRVTGLSVARLTAPRDETPLLIALALVLDTRDLRLGFARCKTVRLAVFVTALWAVTLRLVVRVAGERRFLAVRAASLRIGPVPCFRLAPSALARGFLAVDACSG